MACMVGWDDEREGVSDLGFARCLTSLGERLELVDDCKSCECVCDWDLRLYVCLGTLVLAAKSESSSFLYKLGNEEDIFDRKSSSLRYNWENVNELIESVN